MYKPLITSVLAESIDALAPDNWELKAAALCALALVELVGLKEAFGTINAPPIPAIKSPAFWADAEEDRPTISEAKANLIIGFIISSP
jgi:hypothetical protein